MKEINAFNLIGKLIAIHNNMPNDYLNGLIGESIDCIEKQNQKITAQEVCKLTMKQARKQFNNLEQVKPYLKSDSIMQSILDNLFKMYCEALRVNGLLEIQE